MKKFDIPEIPHELIWRAKTKMAKTWNRGDLDLVDPPMTISWQNIYDDIPGPPTEPKRMVEDPEYDLEVQLREVRRKIKMLEAGSTGLGSFPCLNLIHFGTGPVATAFGSQMVMHTNIQPHFDPAFHTVEEAKAVEMPDLARGGWLGAILDRIEYYNEATQGKIPITISDNAGPWSIATSIWHFEDMLEAIMTDPETVHRMLKIATEAIINADVMQMQAARNSWGVVGDTIGGAYIPRGAFVGDDCMVTVSSQMWKEFFQPYNEIISRNFGGICYHCCMKHDWHLQAMSETEGFIGFDADPVYNDLDKIEQALSGKGVWSRTITDWDIAKRLKEKVGLFLGVDAPTRDEAVENAKRFVEFLHK